MTTSTTPPSSAWDLAMGDTQDLVLDDTGALVLVSDAERAEQAIRRVLLTHAGEWWADITLGVTWREDVLIKAPRLDLIRAIISEQILSVPGVRAVGDILITVDPATRAATITVAATATTGALLRGEITL